MFFRGTARSGFWSVLVSASLLAPSAAALSDEERSGARAAANQGLEAFNQQRWADAVELFSKAEELVHSPVHLSFIARAELKLGHLVKAYETFNRVKRDALPPNASKALTDAVNDATKQLEELEPQLPYVDIKLTGASAKDVTVTMDGGTVPNALLGVRRPIDPGSHVFQASGSKGGSEAVTAEFKTGDKKTVELVVKVELATAVAPALPVTTVAPVSAAAPPPALADSGNGNGLRVGGYVALGVGVVGAALGTVFLLGAKSKQSDSDNAYNACGGHDGCTSSQRANVRSLEGDVSKDKTAALIGYGVAGAAVATGVTLLVLSGKHSNSESARTITPWVGYRALGVTGSF